MLSVVKLDPRSLEGGGLNGEMIRLPASNKIAFHPKGPNAEGVVEAFRSDTALAALRVLSPNLREVHVELGRGKPELRVEPGVIKIKISTDNGKPYQHAPKPQLPKNVELRRPDRPSKLKTLLGSAPPTRLPLPAESKPAPQLESRELAPPDAAMEMVLNRALVKILPQEFAAGRCELEDLSVDVRSMVEGYARAKTGCETCAEAALAALVSNQREDFSRLSHRLTKSTTQSSRGLEHLKEHVAKRCDELREVVALEVLMGTYSPNGISTIALELRQVVEAEWDKSFLAGRYDGCKAGAQVLDSLREVLVQVSALRTPSWLSHTEHSARAARFSRELSELSTTTKLFVDILAASERYYKAFCESVDERACKEEWDSREAEYQAFEAIAESLLGLTPGLRQVQQCVGEKRKIHHEILPESVEKWCQAQMLYYARGSIDALLVFHGTMQLGDTRRDVTVLNEKRAEILDREHAPLETRLRESGEEEEKIRQSLANLNEEVGRDEVAQFNKLHSQPFIDLVKFCAGWKLCTPQQRQEVYGNFVRVLPARIGQGMSLVMAQLNASSYILLREFAGERAGGLAFMSNENMTRHERQHRDVRMARKAAQVVDDVKRVAVFVTELKEFLDPVENFGVRLEQHVHAMARPTLLGYEVFAVGKKSHHELVRILQEAHELGEDVLKTDEDSSTQEMIVRGVERLILEHLEDYDARADGKALLELSKVVVPFLRTGVVRGEKVQQITSAFHGTVESLRGTAIGLLDSFLAELSMVHKGEGDDLKRGIDEALATLQNLYDTLIQLGDETIVERNMLGRERNERLKSYRLLEQENGE